MCDKKELAIDSSECEGYCGDHMCCFAEESGSSCLGGDEEDGVNALYVLRSSMVWQHYLISPKGCPRKIH